jgi:HTH-type transcriptional regulator / antitoxin HigA
MKAEVILIERERDAAEARALITKLGRSSKRADVSLLRAQALLLEAWERTRWPTGPVSPIELIRYAMDQHDLTPADLVPMLGTRSRVTEVLNGKRRLTLTMIRRLHDGLGLPVDLLIADAAPAAA